jgi:hypothetical protein
MTSTILLHPVGSLRLLIRFLSISNKASVIFFFFFGYKYDSSYLLFWSEISFLVLFDSISISISLSSAVTLGLLLFSPPISIIKMKGFMTLVASAAGVHALVNRGDSCCFHLTASGGASGPVGQLSDGQNRIGDNSLSPAEFCIDSNGAITDGNGRGCILTRKPLIISILN